MKQLTTEAAAWAFLARRWAGYIRRWKWTDGYKHRGLCLQIHRLCYVEQRISFGLYERMGDRIHAYQVQIANESAYLWPFNKTGAKARVALCKQFAKEAAAE